MAEAYDSEVDEAEDEVPASFKYENIGLVTSKSVDDKRQTAINHFNCFLMQHYDGAAHKYKTFEEAVKKKNYMQSEDVLGAYGKYLSSEGDRSASQSKGCFSSFVAMLRNEHRMVIRAEFVTRVRKAIDDEFFQKCEDLDREAAGQATPLPIDDLHRFCEVLFKANTHDALQARVSLVLQWQTVGRVGETFTLKLKDIEYCDEIENRCILVRLL